MMRSETSEPTEVSTLKETAPAPEWASLIATFFGAGRITPGPGSWGSLSAILVWVLVAGWIPPRWQPGGLAGLVVIAILLGIPAATRVARSSGIKDPQFVVIDEVVGQWITLLFVPVSWKTIAVGFILFRGF